MCRGVEEGKNEERKDFFEKKLLKSLSVQKKALPLHSHLEKCLLERYNSEGKYCGNSSVGRAQPCQGWGRGSESRFPLNMLNEKESLGIGLNEKMPRWRNW